MCGNCEVPTYPTRSETVEHPLLPRITNTRLDKFFWSPYASQHLDSLLERARYSGPEHVRMIYWSCPGDTKAGYDEAIQQLERVESSLRSGSGSEKEREGVGKEGILEMGYKFGPSWTNHWIKAVITIPEELRNVDQQVIFEFDPSCEALIFSSDDVPQHGITGGTNTMKDGHPGEQEDRRVEHIIPAEAVKKGIYEIVIEVTANGMFGLGPYRYQTPDPNRFFPLVAADIILPNLPVRALKTDFRILTELARHDQAKQFGLAQRALKACDDIMNKFRRVKGDTKNNFEGVDEMIQELREISWSVLGKLDEEGSRGTCVWDKGDREARVWAIGHCHIDTAWLWRYTQTQQKIARSWTTQCDLMDRYPNHQFAASSAQQYAWLESLYPKAFNRVAQYIKEGRFHYVGGAWLEHDCMMPSGESLVRQYLYGQRYFKKKFGSYCREAWLPDTFGYASQLPQILRLAGLNYFFTQKISWNNINVFPYSTFNWSGIDGTQVLAHMTPVDNYNGQCTYGEIVKGVSANKNLEVTDQCLFLFGNGDGGGGPTPLMMEKLERLSSLGHAPEVPKIKMGSPIDFFDDLCRKTDGGRKLPTWKGELYLELHRGTYTSQTGIKKGNRDMETVLRDLEYFATLAALKDSKYQYPKADLDEMWQDTMLAQFHDCLPGTTIKTVVLDNLEIYSKRGAQARGLIAKALDVLIQPSKEKEMTIIDPLRLSRNGIYDHNGELKWLRTEHGLGSFIDNKSLVSPVIDQKEGGWTISNSRFSLTISNGRISSIYDTLAKRELIAPGPGCNDGGLMIYEDLPLNYDAWDAEIYHLKCGSIITFDKVYAKEGGEFRQTLVIEASFGDSKATLEISLDALEKGNEGQPSIRVKAKVDWHEKHKFLKFALPLDIHCAYATYGTQFGVLERPTHRNTTIDQAKFEVCAHGFADLSEATYGLAIASRDKYGYAVEGNVLRLSLVRAPTSPDPETDQGNHEIDFAIIPHQGQLASSQVQTEALKFNNEIYVVNGKPTGLPSFNITGPDAKAIQLETIKRGEDDKEGIETIILRMHESFGGRAQGAIEISGFKVKSAEWVNILEEPMPGNEAHCDLVEKDGEVTVGLNMTHFEIKTLKLVLA